MNFVHSIKFKFTIWYLMILVFLLVLLSGGVYMYLSHKLLQDLDGSLEGRANQLRSIGGVLTSISQGSFQEEVGEIVQLYFHSGGEVKKLSPREVGLSLDEDLIAQTLGGQSSYSTVKTADGTELRIYATPFSPAPPRQSPGGPMMIPEGLDIGSAALVVGRSTADTREALQGLVWTLIIAVPLTLVVAGGGGVFLARRALKPVDTITQTAQEIGETDLSRRIRVDTRDELGRLAGTLNQMIERLERAFKRQQQFTGDASHELRAPLAVIEAESTLALEKERTAEEYRQSLEAVSQEAKHMSGIIEQLLTLARADSGSEQLVFEEVDLAELLDELQSGAELICREKGLVFERGRFEPLLIKGDRAKLKQLFMNLIDNAVRYTAEGGTVTLSPVKDGKWAGLSISDTGIGIPEDDLPHIFERFYRVDKARSRAEVGSGLGLAICRHIAEAHGGSIEVESEPGKGSIFTVRLPLYQS
ncbi:MAG: ATP-binding protein [Dehalococcoidia bacterium]